MVGTVGVFDADRKLAGASVNVSLFQACNIPPHHDIEPLDVLDVKLRCIILLFTAIGGLQLIPR
jgi:hypothetical protein